MFILFFVACIIESHQNVSSTIGIFVHNLIAKDYFSVVLQDEFLRLLGLRVPVITSDDKWLLQIYPRSLAILAQVCIVYYIVQNCNIYFKRLF